MGRLIELAGRAALLCSLCGAIPAAAADPNTAQLIRSQTYPLSFDDGTLSGPGADLLQRETAEDQFVLLGEDHYQFHVPIFAGALYRMLRSQYGFHHLVVEQDRLAIEDALSPANRGNPQRLGALAHRYPSLFEFASDQDLEFLAEVGRLEHGATAICGAEQALGAVRYFDELETLAPNAAVRAEVAAVRQRALKLDSPTKYSTDFLINAETPAQLDALKASFHARSGSRADQLISALIKSSEIFGYYRRAQAGEPVGLLNNTVREKWLKASFMRCYNQMKQSEPLPKAMFKFGANHMYHGKNPTQAFPIGNFAHELAIANGSEAYGIFVQGLAAGKGYDEVDQFVRALLPPTPPDSPLLIDLKTLRPYQRFLRASLKPEDVENFRALINGYEALVVIPNSRPADMRLSGLELVYH